MTRRRTRVVMPAVLMAAMFAALAVTTSPTLAATGIHKIRHVVVIMQENRSFDSYFGTYPGADGIPMVHGKPSVCVPDPKTRTCIAPFPGSCPASFH